MVGKQVVHQVTGVGVPFLMEKIKKALKMTKIHDEDGIMFRWESDYVLDNDHALYEGIKNFYSTVIHRNKTLKPPISSQKESYSAFSSFQG